MAANIPHSCFLILLIFVILSFNSKNIMTFQMHNKSNPAKGDYPYAFSPLPQDASEGPLKVNSSAGKDHGSLSEMVPFVIIMVILAFFFVLTLTFVVGSGSRIIPRLEINSFSISNLNVSTSKVMAVWETNIRIQYFKVNSTPEEFMYYDRIEGCIFYRNMDNMLAAAKGKAFFLGANENKTVQMKFMETGLKADQSGVEDEVVLREISRELENGLMHFSLRIDLGWSLERLEIIAWSDDGYISQYAADSYCWDLMAGVDPSTGKGRLISAQSVCCKN